MTMMRVALSILLLLFLSAHGRAAEKLQPEPPPKPPIVLIVRSDQNWPANHYRVTSYTVHDGDSLTSATVELDFGVALLRQSIRFHDFDAPEVTRTRRTVGKITDEEIAKGKKARDDLAELLKTGEVWISPGGNGFSVYGRLEADVWLVRKGEKINVGLWMKQQGHER